MGVILEPSTFADCPSAERAPSHPGSTLMGWDGWTLCDSIAVLAKPPVSSWGRGTALLPTAAGHIPGAGTWRWEGEGRSTGHELKVHQQTVTANSPQL